MRKTIVEIIEEAIRIIIKLIASGVIVTVFIVLTFFLKKLYIWLYPTSNESFINFLFYFKGIAAMALFTASAIFLLLLNYLLWYNYFKIMKNQSRE